MDNLICGKCGQQVEERTGRNAECSNIFVCKEHGPVTPVLRRTKANLIALRNALVNAQYSAQEAASKAKQALLLAESSAKHANNAVAKFDAMFGHDFFKTLEDK